MKFEKYINKLMSEDILPGGLSDNKSIKDIARKHGVPVEYIKNQLKLGIKVESEHTNDKNKALEIAKDHTFEIKDYYTRLARMENKAKLENESKVKEEMTSGEVVGTSGYGGSGVAPQDKIPYAKGDSRVPKLLFTKTTNNKKKKKKKRRINIQRRPNIGM